MQYEHPRKESAASAGPGRSPIRHVNRSEWPAAAMASNSTHSSNSAGQEPEASLMAKRLNHAASYPSTSNTTCSSQAISSISMRVPSTEATSSALATPRATRSMWRILSRGKSGASKSANKRAHSPERTSRTVPTTLAPHLAAPEKSSDITG